MTEPETAPPSKRQPLYWRALRLKHVHPSSWQRAAFFEGALAVAAIMVLADLASAWLLLALPLAVAFVVKAHDVLVGWLSPQTDRQNAPLALPEAEPESDAEPAAETKPATEEEAQPEPEPNVRVVNSPQAPKPRAARARPGAAAARAQVSSAQAVRRRRAEPSSGKAGRSS